MIIICWQKHSRNIFFLVLSGKNNILQAQRSEGSFRNFLARQRCIKLWCFTGYFHFILSSKIHPWVKTRIGKYSQHVGKSSELLRANLLTNYRMPITQTTPPSLLSMNQVRVAQGTETYVTHSQHQQQPGLSAVLRKGRLMESILTSLARSLFAFAVKNDKASKRSTNPFSFCFSQLLL